MPDNLLFSCSCNKCFFAFHVCHYPFLLDCPMPVPGQRLSFFADAWRKAGANPDLLSLVRDGHKIIFDDGPPPCTLPSQEYETRLPEAKMEVIRGEIDNLLRKGAIRLGLLTGQYRVQSCPCFMIACCPVYNPPYIGRCHQMKLDLCWVTTPKYLQSQSLVGSGV